MRTCDVIVLGLGVMGLATLAELARRGVRVLGIEQYGIGHGRGSSHGVARVFRTAYFEHPDYVPLLTHAHARWRELGELAGESLLVETGAFYAGPADSALIRGTLQSARDHGIAVELLSRDEVHRRYPAFCIPEAFSALFERSAGMLLAERTLAALARLALQDGASVQTFESVQSWQADAGGVRVTTDAGTYHSGKLIVCGGAWSGRLLAELALPLRPTRQVSTWIWPSRPRDFAPELFPTWAIESREGGMYYGFPLHADAPGLKIASHEPGPGFDPETPHRRVDRAEASGARRFVSEYLPSAAGPVTNLQACMYTMTPDGHFIIDRHPRLDNVLLACGFSGHGFKFAPVIGETMADLATSGTTRHPITFLSAARFAEPSE